MALTAGQYSSALGYGIGDMRLDLGQRRRVDQRSLGHARLQTIADRDLAAHRRTQPRGEGVVNAILDQEAVGTDTGLATVAVLG